MFSRLKEICENLQLDSFAMDESNDVTDTAQLVTVVPGLNSVSHERP